MEDGSILLDLGAPARFGKTRLLDRLFPDRQRVHIVSVYIVSLVLETRSDDRQLSAGVFRWTHS